jgi:DNA replication protein DnaC
VVDEIGYVPIQQTGAILFFQLMNRRYERASTVLTSNKGFDEWGEILGDEFMAAALIFRDSNIMDSMIRGLTNKS